MGKISAAWTQLCTSDKLKRSSHILSVVDDNAYIFGGELLPRQPRDNHVYKMDNKVGTAESIATVTTTFASPPLRVGSASSTLHGKIYLFSGRGGEAMAPVEENGAVWVFDPSSVTWTLLSPADPSKPFPLATTALPATATKIYIHAGCPKTGRLSDLWSFQPSSRTWLQLADAPASPRGGTSIAFH